MQIDESRKLLFSDTLVPDIFITEYLPALDGLAVKLYVYALFAARTRRTLTESETARRLGVDLDAIRSATAQLSAAGLVQMRERGFEIVDVKAAEVEKIYRPRTSVDPVAAPTPPGGPAPAADPRRASREKLLGDIAKTFFQGLMSPSWYGEIETWFDRYRFEPEVIYALFQYCAGRGKLDGKGYIAKVAESWSSRGILTFQDLNAYFVLRDKVTGLSRKVGRKLRKGMTEYDEEKVARWVEKLGYDFEIVELALRRTVKLQNPNLDFVDRILEEWFAAKLRTPEDVDRYEAERVRRLSAERARTASDGEGGRSALPDGRRPVRPRNAGNFDQREYSDDYLRSLYDDVAVPALPEAVGPGPTPEGPADAVAGSPAPDPAPPPGDVDDPQAPRGMDGQLDLFGLLPETR
jgi:DnaD/phage-associated family protein